MLRLPALSEEQELPLDLSQSDDVVVGESAKMTSRTAAAFADFEDFYDTSECAVPDGISLETPRKEKAPLKVFQVGTPRPPQSASETSKKSSFVPSWPWGGQWPFNCAPTTLELRGLPRECTTDSLISQLDSSGFQGKYDFVYVPTTRSNANVAIVNTKRHADGCALAGLLHGCTDWEGITTSELSKRKPCRVSWSFSCQGFETLFNYYQQNANGGWYDHEGTYTGPQMYCGEAWLPLFTLIQMWPEQDQWHDPSQSEWPIPDECVPALGCQSEWPTLEAA